VPGFPLSLPLSRILTLTLTLSQAAVQKVRDEANSRLERVVAQTGEKAQMFAAACDNQVESTKLEYVGILNEKEQELADTQERRDSQTLTLTPKTLTLNPKS